jgi:hypothetical protein
MPTTERKTRACVACFEKKLKCDRANPCSKCAKRNSTCLYSHVEKRRKTPQKSAKRIKEIEARVQAMEALIKSRSEGDCRKVATQQSNMEGYLKITANDEMDDQLDDLNEAFPLDIIGGGLPLTQWGVIKHQGPSRQLVKRPLPTMEEALCLLREYFDSFNTVVPLFSEDDFMDRFFHQRTAEPLADVSWWAALNVALAIAYRMRGMRTLQTTELNLKACGFMQNALNVAQDLILSKPDLLSVQALLGIAIVLQGTPNPRPSSIIVAAAVKLSQSLGLHRQSTLAGLSEEQTEQRKRVFWIGYMLDKDYSLQLYHPPAQADLDCDVDLPAEYPDDGLGMMTVANGQDAINIFRLRVQLATIQSETYTILYSVQSSKLSLSARSLAIENLDNRLKAWKRSIPLDFRPDTLTQSVPPIAIIHLVILFMTYFNCLTMIHSISFRDEYWTASASDTVEGTIAGDPISVGRTLCLPAARLAVRLVSLLPRGDYACMWLLLHHYVSAVVILLANIIQHPKDDSAHTDMGLIEPLLRLFESLTIGHSVEGGEDLRELQAFCLSLEHKAKTALENTQFALRQMNIMTAYLPMSARAA